MIRKLWHIYRLGLKELISFRYDYVLVVLVIYSFTVMVIVPSKGTGLQVRNSSVAYVDEDQSPLSARIIDAIQLPYFQKPQAIAFQEINQVLDRAEYIFVIHIPSGFQKDLLSGKTPEVSIDVDATAIGHAKLGTSYLSRIINDEIQTYLHGAPEAAGTTRPGNHPRAVQSEPRKLLVHECCFPYAHDHAALHHPACCSPYQGKGTGDRGAPARHAPCPLGDHHSQGLGEQLYRGGRGDVCTLLFHQVGHRGPYPRFDAAFLSGDHCLSLCDNRTGCFPCNYCQESAPGRSSEHAHYRAHLHAERRDNPHWSPCPGSSRSSCNSPRPRTIWNSVHVCCSGMPESVWSGRSFLPWQP